ncbi:MAG: DUF1499 domain-containing protein [Gemmatimonadaceae bacterium]|nr:DUF1499 domain-containing protein [Acetobacteraceae bacterium]
MDELAMAVAAGLMVAGCGMTQVVAPPPGDLAGLQRPSSPNTALAGPPGFLPAPDLPTRLYALPPDQLFAVARGVVAALPRSVELANDVGRRRVDHVVRSLVFRFPDIVQIQVVPTDGGSALVVYSYSLIGRSDLGVNRSRVAAILAAVDGAVPAGS